MLRRRFIFLALLTAAAAGLRFFRIDGQPLWLDEAFSVWMGSQSPGEIVRLAVDIDQHPPVYHLLLHLWMRLGGTGEAWVRAFSALLGAATVPAIYGLGSAIAGPRVGLASALILAFSPFHVQYGQEARPYAMLTLFACLSMWAAARLLIGPSQEDVGDSHPPAREENPITQPQQARSQPKGGGWRSHRDHQNPTKCKQLAAAVFGAFAVVTRRSRAFARRRNSSRWFWPGYAIFTALALYGHNSALFLPLAVNLFALGLAIHHRRSPAGGEPFPVKRWLAAQAGVFLLWSPWLAGFLAQARDVSGGFWVQPPDAVVVVEALKTFVSAYLPERLSWQRLIWWGYLGLFALAALKFRRQPGRFAFLAALFLTPFLGELIVSLRAPIFVDHTLIWAALPLYVLLAAGISRLRFREYVVTALLILLTVNGLSLHNYFTYDQKERWDSAAAYVAANARVGDAVLFNAAWGRLAFDYYFDRIPHAPVEPFGAPVDLFERGELEPKMTGDDLPRLRSILRGRERVWLVYAHYWWTDPQSLITTALDQEMRLESFRLFNGIQVHLYVRR